ncbi:sigma-70 family RNA polymerase sigma factor [Lachnospiraceae bacterium MD308]|nr:sigma-70 family RNA polymerase sigma factor [Lachnospiraceae bacterium MD308]
MRGRKSKERDRYVVRMEDRTLVEVSRDVYLEWYQSKRRERYQQEKCRKYGVCSLNELEEKGDYSRMRLYVQDDPEEVALRNVCREKVREALRQLSETDAELIVLLYFKEVTVTEAARIYGCCRETIRGHRKRILEKLHQIIQNQE